MEEHLGSTGEKANWRPQIDTLGLGLTAAVKRFVTSNLTNGKTFDEALPGKDVQFDVWNNPAI